MKSIFNVCCSWPGSLWTWTWFQYWLLFMSTLLLTIWFMIQSPLIWFMIWIMFLTFNFSNHSFPLQQSSWWLLFNCFHGSNDCEYLLMMMVMMCVFPVDCYHLNCDESFLKSWRRWFKTWWLSMNFFFFNCYFHCQTISSILVLINTLSIQLWPSW